MTIIPLKKPADQRKEAVVFCYGCRIAIPISKQKLEKVMINGEEVYQPFCCEGCAHEHIVSTLYR